jgi:hypothetical protein
LILLTLAILVPLFTGLLICAALIVHTGGWKEWLLALFMAPGVGVAAASVLYFFWCVFFQPAAALPVFLALESLILLSIAISLWLFRRDLFRFSKVGWKKWVSPVQWSLRTWVIAAGVVLFILSMANFLEDWLLAFFAAPDGNWDAWAIWNLHARFIASGAAWQTGFSPEMNLWSHPDYPLLIPTFIAQIWAFLGSQSQYVPALVELCFLLCIPGIVVSSVNWARGWKSAVFAGLFTVPILAMSLSFQQYVDMPLAMFFLAANLILWAADNLYPGSPRLLVMAGLMIGAALWTKNEGWALLLAAAVIELLKFIVEKPRFSGILKRWMWLAVGFLPMFAAVLVFKEMVTPPNDLVASFGQSNLLSKLLDGSHYALLWENFLENIFSIATLKVAVLPALVGYVLLAGWGEKGRINLGVLWIGLRVFVVGFIYFVIYLLTPHSLEWHIATSMGRLIVHLLPSLVLAVFLLANSLDSPLKQQ